MLRENFIFAISLEFGVDDGGYVVLFALLCSSFLFNSFFWASATKSIVCTCRNTYVKRKQRMHFFENRKLIKLTPRIGVWDCIISCRNREYNIMMNMSLNLKPFIKETTNGNDIAGFATFYIVFLFL